RSWPDPAETTRKLLRVDDRARSNARRLSRLLQRRARVYPAQWASALQPRSWAATPSERPYSHDDVAELRPRFLFSRAPHAAPRKPRARQLSRKNRPRLFPNGRPARSLRLWPGRNSAHRFSSGSLLDRAVGPVWLEPDAT